MSTAEICKPMKNSRKEKIRHEVIEYGFNVIYLTLVFASFPVYRKASACGP